MHEFVSGALMLGLLVVGLFFVRFYRQTRDRLFIYFAIAFWVLASSRVVLALVDAPDEVRPAVYLLRLAAFAVILFAIIDKNRTAAAAASVRRGS